MEGEEEPVSSTAAEDERAAIVAWLRQESAKGGLDRLCPISEVFDWVACLVEAGEHLK